MTWFVLLAILATLQADRALAQEVSLLDRFQLFNECRPMDLLVEEVSSDADEIDLATASILAAVESRLRSARLYDSETPLSPYLYVNVNVSGLAFSASLRLQQTVSRSRFGCNDDGDDMGHQFYRHTWR